MLFEPYLATENFYCCCRLVKYCLKNNSNGYCISQNFIQPNSQRTIPLPFMAKFGFLRLKTTGKCFLNLIWLQKHFYCCHRLMKYCLNNNSNGYCISQKIIKPNSQRTIPLPFMAKFGFLKPKTTGKCILNLIWIKKNFSCCCRLIKHCLKNNSNGYCISQNIIKPILCAC